MVHCLGWCHIMTTGLLWVCCFFWHHPRAWHESLSGIKGKFYLKFCCKEQTLPRNYLLSQWLTGFELLGIPYLVGKIKFKLFFQGPLAKWDYLTHTHTFHHCHKSLWFSQRPYGAAAVPKKSEDFLRGGTVEALQHFRAAWDPGPHAVHPECETHRAYTASWRIIPLSKYLVTTICKPFRPFGRGISPLRGLTNHGY